MDRTNHGKYSFRTYHRPSLYLPQEELQALKADLLRLGSICLDPLPDYQVFSSDPSALDDKIICAAYYADRGEGEDTPETHSQRELVAFTSGVLLAVEADGIDDQPVIHTGLTVVAPSHRQNHLPLHLVLRLAGDALAQYRVHHRLWMTSLTELPLTLSHFYRGMQHIYPSPDVRAPSATHVAIARAVSQHHRPKMLIAQDAVFDEERFVFQGSNAKDEARCFRKMPGDSYFRHADRSINDFYEGLTRRGQGDEVLQVGYVGPEHFRKVMMLSRRGGGGGGAKQKRRGNEEAMLAKVQSKL